MRPSIAATTVLLLLSGCLSRYDELRDEEAALRSTPFLEASRAAAPDPPRAQGRPAGERPEIEEMRRRKEAWLTAVGDPPAAVRFLDLESEAARRTLAWADDEARVREFLAGRPDGETLVVLAFARNEGVDQALLAWRSVLARYEQAAYFDDVLAQYEAFARELAIPFGPMEFRGKQPIGEIVPPPGALARKGDVLDAEVGVARDRFRLEVAKLVTEVRKTLADLVYVDVALEIARTNQRILSDLKDVVTVKYEAGSAEYANVLRSQAELDEIENLLITLGTERESLVALLAALLDLPSGVSIGSPAPIEHPTLPELPALLQLARESNQELDVLRSRIAQMEAAIRLAEDRTFYKYVQNYYLFDYRGGSAGMERPMASVPYWFGQMDAFLEEMRARLAAMRQELENMTHRVLAETEKAYWEADAQLRLAALYRSSLVEKAKQALEANRTGYQAARVGFLDVLDAERKLFQFELAGSQAQRDALKAWAELQRQIGRSP